MKVSKPPTVLINKLLHVIRFHAASQTSWISSTRRQLTYWCHSTAWHSLYCIYTDAAIIKKHPSLKCMRCVTSFFQKQKLACSFNTECLLSIKGERMAQIHCRSTYLAKSWNADRAVLEKHHGFQCTNAWQKSGPFASSRSTACCTRPWIFSCSKPRLESVLARLDALTASSTSKVGGSWIPSMRLQRLHWPHVQLTDAVWFQRRSRNDWRANTYVLWAL